MQRKGKRREERRGRRRRRKEGGGGKVVPIRRAERRGGYEEERQKRERRDSTVEPFTLFFAGEVGCVNDGWGGRVLKFGSLRMETEREEEADRGRKDARRRDDV